jgi:hypothetical protein
MKVRAGEHEEQTTRYVREPTLGNGLEKEDFPETGRHYAFLANESKSADASEFRTVGWQSVVRSFEELLDEYGQFPIQSLVQLNDFCRTIRNETGMSKEKQNRNDLAALAVEYADEIEQVNEALKSYTDELQETWGEQLDEQPPSSWKSNWTTHTNAQWANFYRPEWRIPPTDTPTAEGSDTRFHLRVQHEITQERLKRGSVCVKLQVTGSDEPIVDEFYRRLHAPGTVERIESVVEGINKQPNTTATFYNRPELVHKKIMHINRDSEFDSGNGYISALRSGLEELHPAAEIVDEIYEETVATKL